MTHTPRHTWASGCNLGVVPESRNSVLLRYRCRRFHPTHVARRYGDSMFGAVAHLSASQTGGIFDGSVRKLPTGVALFVDALY